MYSVHIAFIPRVEGTEYNVVFLPVCGFTHLQKLFRKIIRLHIAFQWLYGLNFPDNASKLLDCNISHPLFKVHLGIGPRDHMNVSPFPIE